MEHYFILCNWTQKGAENLKESPARIEAARKAIESAGGKWHGWWLTMGAYDFVVHTEAPNAQTAAQTLLAIGSLGNVKTETLRAFSEEEFKGMVGRLP